MSEWYSAAFVVPSNDRKVIVFTENEGIDYGGWYNKHHGKMRWFASDGAFASVTHWREMLDPPLSL